MAKITKNDEGKVVSLADEEELRALDNPVLTGTAVTIGAGALLGLLSGGGR